MLVLMSSVPSTDVISLVQTLGFPIFICLILMWYIKYTNDNHTKQLKEERDSHEEEMKKMTEALNNNTLVIQKLVDKLGGE